jgi:hypothetical protein
MRRVLTAIAIGAVLALAWASFARGAQPFTETGRVVFSSHGNVTIPHDERADAVVVVDGTADIHGTVGTVVIVDGEANFAGAQVESVVAIGSKVEIGPDSHISNQVMRLDSTVHQTGNAVIDGGITDLAPALLSAGAALAPAVFLLWLGFGLATIASALLVAGLAGRQLFAAARLLAAEPGKTFLIGLAAVVLLPVVAILLMVTVIGAPLGVGLLIGAMPLLAYVGYLVAATWVGGWVVRQMAPRAGEGSERPFMPVLVGVLVLTVLGLLPILTIVVAVASLLGVGAVMRLGIQILRGAPRPVAGAPRTVTAPTGA